MKILKHPVMIIIFVCIMIGSVFPINHFEALINIDKPLVKTHLAVNELWYESSGSGSTKSVVTYIRGTRKGPPDSIVTMSASYFYDGTYLGDVSIQEYIRMNDSILPIYYVPNTNILYPYKKGDNILDFVLRKNEIYWFFGCVFIVLFCVHTVYRKDRHSLV